MSVRDVSHRPVDDGRTMTDERWQQIRHFNEVVAMLLEAERYAADHGVSFKNAVGEAHEAYVEMRIADATRDALAREAER